MNIAIIGAGIGGMAAAHDLQRAGHQVTIFEAADIVGGLATGFKEPHWDWSVEKFYHHWFQSDADMLGLLEELGLRDRVLFFRPKTVSYFNEKFYPLDSPLAALTFPGYNFINMVRFGLVTVFIRYLASWKKMEQYGADEWMRRWYGDAVYNVLLEPLLQGKFGPHFKEVNMAWMWARLKARSTRLGTFQGGFQAFNDAFADQLRQRGVQIRLSTPVSQIQPRPEGGLRLEVSGEFLDFDQCLVTTSPALMARMAPALPQDYLKGLLDLKSMGAVVMVMSLSQQLSKEGYYWYNLPKSAGYPFLALVEHTNFVSAEHFGGDHIVYCGDYLDVDHEYFRMTKEELLQRFMPSLAKINPDFKPEWVRNSWVFRSTYAQPIPLINHSGNIPDIKTPVPGLFFASMSQIYPWDRGTNFAVQIARQAAREMLAELKA
jgi:protoporphyrinogen oxidase